MSIHNPAKLLSNYLNNIHIADANVSNLVRLNDCSKQLYVKSNSKDLFSSNFDDFDFNIEKEAAFLGFASKIKDFSLAIKFNLMIVPPKAVMSCSLNIVDNVIIRSIEYYEIAVDEVLTRYDILIEKVSNV